MAILGVDLLIHLVANPVLLLIGIVVIVISINYSKIRRYFRQKKYISKIPTKHPGLPILGHALEFNVGSEDLFDVFLSFCSNIHPIQHAWLLQQPYVFLYRPETVKIVLSSTTLLDKSNDYTFMLPWLGTGLLTSTGEKWFKRRRMLTPTFHFKILEDFLVVFNEQSQVLVNKIKSDVGGPAFDIAHYSALCTLDIICETAMGKKINAQSDGNLEYMKAVYRISDLILIRMCRPWLQWDWIWKLSRYGKEEKFVLKLLHDFTDNVIQERKKEFNARMESNERRKNSTSEDDVTCGTGKKRLAFLDLLLESAQEYDLQDNDLREEVDTFMFEGHDTTAFAITWTLFLLAVNQNEQKLVQAELDAIFGDSDRAVTSVDLTKMKYLELCIKESLRLYPSVPMIARKLNEDITLANYVVPAGTTTAIVTYMLHRDPEIFPDPEKFIPERFLPENAQGRHPYAYVPFSAGPRNCIGQKFAIMEEKVIISSVLRHFSLQAVDTRETISLIGDLILRPRFGLKLIANLRSK